MASVLNGGASGALKPKDVYSFFTNAKKLKERMPMPMSQLITEVSKTEFKPKQQYATFEICCNDVEDDEDVEVPYVRYKFRGF